MNLPVKARLTLWYVMLFAITIGLWSVFVINRVRADLYSGLDRSLAARATQIEAVLSSSGKNSAFKDATDSTLVGVAPTQAIAQLLSPIGEVLQHSGDPVSTAPVVEQTVLDAADASGKAQISTVPGSQDKKFRVLAVKLPDSNRFLLVGQATDATDAAIQRLALVMALWLPLALLAAGLVGWFLARRALRPVSRMTTTAANIGINHLDERLPVPPANDELRALAETLNGMLQRLETGVRDKRRLIANASHELQTPLAVMRTELDVYLASSDLPADALETLESVREEADRMSRIVRNLLALARFDDGNLTLLREANDLHALAEEAVASLEQLARERHVSVSVEGEEAIAMVDREYVRLVIANLVENAIRYSGEGAEVRIFTRAQGDEAVLAVADTGPGIPASAVPHIFDRFYRAGESRAKERGSGLGLAITKEIVETHGGVVVLETEQGVGTRFIVHFPSHVRTPVTPPAENPEGLASETDVDPSEHAAEAPPALAGSRPATPTSEPPTDAPESGAADAEAPAPR